MKLAALISGGKDSLYAAYLCEQAGHEITTIISMQPANMESYMFHYPNTWIVEVQARLMGIPYVQQTTPGEKEIELDDLSKVLKELLDKESIEGVVTGAVASNYQKKRIDKICAELGLQSIAPLWGIDPATSIEGMISDGFEIIIQAVAAPPLDETWLGRKLDIQCLNELIELNKKYGIHIMFEGGEAESLVLDCPMFSKKIVIKDSEKKWDAKTRSGMLEIKSVDTRPKI